MKNELRQHKKSDRVKWCIAFAAILLLAAGLTLICLQLFTPYKPSNGFKEVKTDARVAVTNDSKAAGSTLTTETVFEGTGTATVHIITSNEDYSVPYALKCEHTYKIGGGMDMYSTTLTFTFSSLPSNYVNLTLVRPTTYSGETVSFSGNQMTFFAVCYSVLTDVYFTCEVPWTMIPLPEPPTKEGYTFTGWYTDEACTNKYVGETVRDDMTLYAGWQINRYTVTYDSNGGINCESVTVDWNTSPTLPTPTREGYDFVGWFDGDTQYTDQPIKENKTLTAHWEIMTFTVTFMVDGEPYKTVTVDYGTGLSDAADIAELTYYTFYDASGVREGRSAVITENTTLSAAEMSKAEKIGFFLARNNWILIAGAASIGVLLLTTIIMGIVIKKRG